MKRNLFAVATAAVISLGTTALAYATPTQVGVFEKSNDCGGAGGFAACHMDDSGGYQEPDTAGRTGSPSIFKQDFSGLLTLTGTEVGSFASILGTGTEFTFTYDSGTKLLTWTYVPTGLDPKITYWTYKQGSSYVLYKDLAGATSHSIDLDTLGALVGTGAGISHISFFDSTSGGGGGEPAADNVPAPMTLALLGAALAGLGVARRSKR